MNDLPYYQVYLNGSPYYPPVYGRLAAMAVYAAACDSGVAEIRELNINHNEDQRSECVCGQKERELKGTTKGGLC